MSSSTYYIKESYTENVPVNAFDFTSPENSMSDARIYQTLIYGIARGFIKKHQLQSIADLGCGVGYKLNILAKAFKLKRVVGFDTPATVKLAKTYFPDLEFKVFDANEVLHVQEEFDLIICADVIEHIRNPDHLLYSIKKLAHPKSLVIISTPERNVLYGLLHDGPSRNTYHIREWSLEEFHRYLESRGFQVLVHETVPAICYTSFFDFVSDNGFKCLFPIRVLTYIKKRYLHFYLSRLNFKNDLGYGCQFCICQIAE